MKTVLAGFIVKRRFLPWKCLQNTAYDDENIFKKPAIIYF